jgi:hypothetical protein
MHHELGRDGIFTHLAAHAISSKIFSAHKISKASRRLHKFSKIEKMNSGHIHPLFKAMKNAD